MICIVLHAMGWSQQSLRFIENKGQWPAQITHRAELNGATIWCEQGAMVIDRYDAFQAASAHGNIEAQIPTTLRAHAVRLRFLNPGANARTSHEGRLRGHYNFMVGHDPKSWAAKASAYARVTMHDVAPGCDAVFTEGRSGLKYDLVLAPGASAEDIAFTYEGADGLRIRNGALMVETSLGRMVERIPIAYQEIGDERRVVSCRYTLKGSTVGIQPGAYDHDRPLIIDPTLSFATYSGSTSNNFGYTATFDQAGFLYAGSTAFGTQFPVTMGAYQMTWAGGTTDIAITKYDTTGSFLVWSTYLGGSAAEMPHSLIVDENDQLLVLGTTGSSDFPMGSAAFDGSFAGGTAFTPAGLGLSYPNGCDMILARLNSDGSALIGATYLGGSANDGLNSAPALKFNYADEVRGEILLDNDGKVWVVSCTQSGNAPVTANAAQASFGGGSHDGYIARFNPDLSQLEYASFIGGGLSDAAFSGEFDPSNRLYLCGGTTSADLATTTTAFDGVYNGGASDAFAARLRADGTAFDALTYWGSTGYDQAYFVELDTQGSAYLFGQTNSPSGQLISNAPYNLPGGGQFITKFDENLSQLLLSSRVGAGDGTPDISPTAFLVDFCDKIYTSGWGSSAGGLGGGLTTNGLPVTSDAHQSTTDGHDLYLAVFDINMNALTYATYYGGGVSPEHVDGGTSRFDRRGRVYQSVCAGCQNNDDFPTSPDAWSATNNSTGCNNGVLKFDFDAPLVIAAFTAPDTVCANAPFSFNNLSSNGLSFAWDFGDTGSSDQFEPSHTYAQPGSYVVTLNASNGNTCNAQDLYRRRVVVLPAAPALVAMADVTTCDPITSFTLTANSNGTASEWQWSSTDAFTDVLNASPGDSTAILSPVVSGTYHVRASNEAGCSSTSSITINAPFAGASLSEENTICAGDTLSISVLGLPSTGYSFIWEPANEVIGGAGTANITLAPSEQMVVTVNVSGPLGCTWEDAITVFVSPLVGATVSATADPTILLPGGTTQLQATPSNANYIWQPAALLSNATIANPVATVQETTTFIVTVTDGICTRSDSVKVLVYDLRCEEPDVFVPNTFTPNGDGANDTLFVRGQHIERMEFMVFDRWGERVFLSTDKNVGWDGQFRGKPVDPAVFVYHLTAWCADGQRYFTKGNVTVIR